MLNNLKTTAAIVAVTIIFSLVRVLMVTQDKYENLIGEKQAADLKIVELQIEKDILVQEQAHFISQLNSLESDYNDALAYSEKVNNALDKHNLQELTREKPTLVLKVINNATFDYYESLKDISKGVYNED